MQLTPSFDRTIERILRVKPVEARTVTEERSAENTFMASMLFTGIRCVLEYIVLPFVLPPTEPVEHHRGAAGAGG